MGEHGHPVEFLLRNVRSDSGHNGDPNTAPDAAIADSVGSKETTGPAVTALEDGVPEQVEL